MSCYKLIVLVLLCVEVFPVTGDNTFSSDGLTKRYEYVKEKMNKKADLEAEIDILKSLISELKNETSELKTKNEYMLGRFEELTLIENKTIVAVNAKASGGIYSENEIVKFPTLLTSVGLINPDDFISTGQFTCTFPGLYLVSLTLFSNTDYATFGVYKNSDFLNQLSIRSLTVTGVFVVELQAGDTVYVDCKEEQIIVNISMMTIVKIE